MPSLGKCAALNDEKAYEKHADGYKYLVQGKDGWLFRSGTDFRDDFSLEKETIASLKAVKSILQERNIDLAIVLPPTRGIMSAAFIDPSYPAAQKFDVAKAKESFKAMLAEMNAAGIAAPDLTAMPDPGSFFHMRDIHWNDKGARYAAEQTAKILSSHKSFKALEHKTFTTKEEGVESYMGPMGEAAEKLCGVKIPEEFYTRTTTEADESSSDPDSLFGDETPPQIVLIGTSFSTNHSNFPGFLKDAFEADVQNVAVAGGGFDSSALAYFASEQFRKNPPKIIVWELPGHYNINDEEFFRQLLPAIYGDCGSAALAAAEVVEIQGKKVRLLKRLEDKHLKFGEAYLSLTFDKPVAMEFSAIFTDDKNGRQSYKFKRAKRYPHDGLFFYAPAQKDRKDEDKQPDSFISSVSLNVPEGMDGMKVTARLCKMAPAQGRTWSEWFRSWVSF